MQRLIQVHPLLQAALDVLHRLGHQRKERGIRLQHLPRQCRGFGRAFLRQQPWSEIEADLIVTQGKASGVLQRRRRPPPGVLPRQRNIKVGKVQCMVLLRHSVAQLRQTVQHGRQTGRHAADAGHADQQGHAQPPTRVHGPWEGQFCSKARKIAEKSPKILRQRRESCEEKTRQRRTGQNFARVVAEGVEIGGGMVLFGWRS
mmetsp:Transcript_9406/g.35223  ORF Transcript_9406/g.35223 Transcript_9406/m.35223 type:complete len:202 (-) Transcript_9406:23-628(-)